MDARLIGAVYAAGLALATLVMAPAATAAPISAPEFEAAMSAAVAASGTFARGTTLVVEVEIVTSGDAKVMTVNPDGSLTGRTYELMGVREVKCVRVNRCWERGAGTYIDDKWHLLPRGSVDYSSPRGFWAESTGGWMDGTTYDVTDVPGIGRVFTAVEPGTDYVMSMSVTVNGPRLTYSLSIVPPDGAAETVVSMSMSARQKAVEVNPPVRRMTGLPTVVRTYVPALINR